MKRLSKYATVLVKLIQTLYNSNRKAVKSASFMHCSCIKLQLDMAEQDFLALDAVHHLQVIENNLEYDSHAEPVALPVAARRGWRGTGTISNLTNFLLMG